MLPQSAVPGFMEEIQDKNKIIINQIFLIYKHYVYPSKNYEISNLIFLKKKKSSNKK